MADYTLKNHIYFSYDILFVTSNEILLYDISVSNAMTITGEKLGVSVSFTFDIEPRLSDDYSI